MAKQFTAIMAREAIIGPTINSQVDGLESNIGRKGYCGELEREIKGRGLSFYLFSLPLSLFSTLIPLFPSSLQSFSLFYPSFFLQTFPLLSESFGLFYSENIRPRHAHTYTHFSNGFSATIKWLFPHTPLNTLIVGTDTDKGPDKNIHEHRHLNTRSHWL